MVSTISTRQWLAAALMSLICLAGYAYFATQAFVKINVDTGSATHFHLYWKTGEANQYSEAQSTLIQIYPNKQFYTSVMGDLQNATHLRVNPSNGTDLFRLTELSIYQAGFEPIRFMGRNLKKLKVISGVGKQGFDEAGMVYQPTQWDSTFETELKLEPETDSTWTHLWRIGLLIGFGLLLMRAYPSITEGLRYVPVLMLLIFGLITTMSIISRPHAHPDEHAHLQAAYYYEQHDAPPAACDAETLSTYTNYGTSRLNTNELAYFISGKFLQFTDIIPLAEYQKLRLFNLGLFALLLLLVTLRPAARIIVAPLLISPQFWYVFSYFNSDALAIFTALIIAYQVVAPDTLFKNLIHNTSQRPVLSFIALSLLACFLLLTKKNFYFFGLFLLGAAVVYLWLNRHLLKSQNIRLLPAVGVLLSAALAFGSWTYYQGSIHDFERSAKVLECREQTAQSAFKPSAPLDQSSWSLSFDKRGISIPEMLDKGWAKNVFMSAFGNFGYVAHPASRVHYQLVALSLLGLVLYLTYAVIRRGNAFQRWLLAGAAALFAMLIAITIYKSWTVDYQPQGRYYFAMIPILGALLGWLRSCLNKRVLSIFVLILFALGFYVFISVGLLEIRKVGT